MDFSILAYFAHLTDLEIERTRKAREWGLYISPSRGKTSLGIVEPDYHTNINAMSFTLVLVGPVMMRSSMAWKK